MTNCPSTHLHANRDALVYYQTHLIGLECQDIAPDTHDSETVEVLISELETQISMRGEHCND